MLSDADWIGLANDSLPPNLSALNARIVAGSRTDRFLQVSYRPSPESITFISLSGGCVAEMLDQAAAHGGTFVTSYGCPTLTMTANYLHAGTGSAFVATAGSVGRDKRLGSHYGRAHRRARKADRFGIRRRAAGQRLDSLHLRLALLRRNALRRSVAAGGSS